MARTIGTSGAWEDVAEDARRWGVCLGKPDDIGSVLDELKESYQPSIARKEAEVAQEVADARQRIEDLQAVRGFYRWVLNWFQVRRLERYISRQRSEESDYIFKLTATIESLEGLLVSPKLAGAQAELDVTARLERLPDDHVVFNDVHLKSERYIHFGGRPIQSAQIDHLVLAPSGIFVIETKLWSRNFVESGNYHDPFDQIQRASYLCYDLVREHFGKVRVRSVIACAGALPQPPKGTYVKVLHPTEIIGYISWFKDQRLSPDDTPKLSRFFERRQRWL